MKSCIPAMLRLIIFFPVLILCSCSGPEPVAAQLPLKASSPLLIRKVIVSQTDTAVMQFVNDEALYREGWDTLAQPRFWKKVMCLSPDSAIMNVASCRAPLEIIDFNQWMTQTELEKNIYKQKICCSNQLDCNTNVFVTKGRRDFFEHRKSLASVSKAVEAFQLNGVDPWYAQTILLIESPGKSIQKSWAGAQGPFQLMRDVAVHFGLRVNRYTDERTDLSKSAVAASKLISTICIPKVKIILDSLNISYNETDTWFRLLVLHAYHAGAGNVACAVYSIAPKSGGMDLIRQLWQTECHGFKNESQNYSQLALAAHLSFNEILGSSDTVFLVRGDKLFAEYSQIQNSKPLTVSQLNSCIDMYGQDLVDGTLEAEDYLIRINKLKARLTDVASANESEYLTVGKELMRKRKVDDAIKVFKYTIEQYPQSALAADSLSRAYKISGNMAMAQKYEKMSNELSRAIEQ